MIPKTGRFIVHDLGSARLLRVVDIFFQSCRQRLAPLLHPDAQYEPWMACSEHAAQIVARGVLPDYIRSDGVLDFRANYLSTFRSLVSETAPINAFTTDYGANLFTINSQISLNQRSSEIFQHANDLCEQWSDWQKEVRNSLHKSIFPLKAIDNDQLCLINYSHRTCIGATFHSVPAHSLFPDLSLNISFAHELGHQALFIYEQSGAITFENDTPLYSGIRRTMRPPRNVLHAAVALSYMIECIKSLARYETRIDRAAFLSALHLKYTDGLRLTITGLEKSCHSEVCKLIVNDTKTSLAF